MASRPIRQRLRALVIAPLGVVALLAGLLTAPVNAQITPVYPDNLEGLQVIPSDLEFILAQIKISEAHSNALVTGDPNYSLLCASQFDNTGTCVPHPLLPWGLRTVDGSFNNLVEGQSGFGAADQFFPRLLPIHLREGVAPPPFSPPAGDTSACADPAGSCYAQTSGFVYDPEPRLISNLIVTQTDSNPAAAAVAAEIAGSTTDAEGRIFIPNEAPDEGLSASFNLFLTFFGQFFDHGLDLVNKGGSGTVVTPLNPDDPLYVPGSPTNFLALSRVTNDPGPNGILGDGDDIRAHNNQTTPFVDQNQTYTSHPSHQVFLREYDANADATGNLLDGANGGLANWAETKAQARDILGIELDDRNILSVPLLLTDPYGNFVPGDLRGLPQVAFPGATPEAVTYVEGDTANPVQAVTAVSTGHGFLDDIAHAAVPVSSQGNPRLRENGVPIGGQPLAGNFDGDLLDAHFITGDGRGNENIALTSVHHVFHAEHNRLTAHIRDVLDANPALKAQFEDPGAYGWSYGQRIFQAGRFVTEMEYQHGVFEEFARTIQPEIDIVPFNESSYHSNVNAAITAEFAHVVYRFGHTMLTESVPRRGFGTSDVSLLEAFLNPRLFTMNGALTPDQAAGSVFNGMVDQPGSGIDEFVTDTLRNSLLGLPLDLPAINMMRGRDAGVPPLQVARERFFAATGNSDLEPYSSWNDFGLALKHPQSLVNFVAAYGIHPTLTDPPGGTPLTVDARRAAATTLLDDSSFMNAPAADTGVDDIDFWMGGLAEAGIPFGGMLGTTFNYVFETQLEDLQNGDRFYYLSRNIGRNLLHQLEANSFSALVGRTTDSELIPAFAFATPNITFDIFNTSDADLAAGGLLFDAGTGQYRYSGEEHVNIHGTPGNDNIRTGIGDDSIVGFAGDDYLIGGAGANSIVGNEGNDRILGLSGDDNIKGSTGNDVINGGAGLDLLLGGPGSDFIIHGSDPTNNFSGHGNDFNFGGDAHDIMTGNEGDDWLEGQGGSDLLQGDNSNGFQDDPGGGHDVLSGGGGNDDLDSEGGDDILITSPGTDRHEGMLGFDWVTHQNDPGRAVADLDNTIFQPPTIQNLRDRFDLVEGLSGWNFDDILRGAANSDAIDGSGQALTQAQLDRVIGLRDLLGGGATPPYAAPFLTAQNASDILIGGAGGDLIEGRGGDDFIDGDAWLNVRLDYQGTDYEGLTPLVPMAMAGTLNPGDISIEREIITGNGSGVTDTAVFSDVADNYDVTANGDGTWTVNHARGTVTDGIDIVRNIERLTFSDVSLSGPGFTVASTPQGSVTTTDNAPIEGQPISGTVTFAAGVTATNVLFEWQQQEPDDTWLLAQNGINADFTPTNMQVGAPLRLVVTFISNGTINQLVSLATDPVLNVNDLPTGLVIDNTSPSVGDTLAAQGLTDADGTVTSTLTHQWLEGIAAPTTPIPGATASTFTVGTAQEGLRLAVQVSYTDDHGTAEVATSAATQPVAPAPVVVPPAPAPGPGTTQGTGGTPGPGTTPGPGSTVVPPGAGSGGTPAAPGGGGGAAGGGTDPGAGPGTDPGTDPVTPPAATDPVQRLAGAGRTDTAVAISQATFATAGTRGTQTDLSTAESVVLSRADVYSDALAGTPLATRRNGPILLTSTTGLDANVLAEIQRILRPGGTVYLLGGRAALSPTVEQALAAAGYETVRYSGPDRFATAVAIADQGLDNPPFQLFATGINFPDALAAGAAASHIGGAVLLTADDVIPDVVADYIDQHPAMTYAVGGPAANALPTAVPLVGANRFETASIVAQRLFTEPTAVGLASGDTFPDALTGGAHAASQGGPLLLSGQALLPAETVNYIQGTSTIGRIYLYGGEAALAASVASDAGRQLP